MPRVSLSQDAKQVLGKIYKVYLSTIKENPSDTFYYKEFSMNAIFHNLEDSEFMPSLVELSSQGMIRVLSDRRIILNDSGISYIKKQLKRRLINLNDIET